MRLSDSFHKNLLMANSNMANMGSKHISAKFGLNQKKDAIEGTPVAEDLHSFNGSLFHRDQSGSNNMTSYLLKQSVMRGHKSTSSSGKMGFKTSSLKQEELWARPD